MIKFKRNSSFPILTFRPILILRILKMIHQRRSTLNSGVGQLTYLFTVELVPSSPIELLIEVKNEFSMNEVDKGVPNITGVMMIHRKVEKVDFHFIISANFLKKHILSVLVRDVPYHQCGPSIELNLNK